MNLDDIHKIYGKIKLLHIDDDDLQLNLLKENLHYLNKNIDIESETNLEKAIGKIKEKYYDCVLIDLIMPDGDGVDSSIKIRQYSDVPIILYTQKDSKNLTDNFFISGITDYLTKQTGINHFKILDKKIREKTKKYRNKMIYEEIISSNNYSLVIIEKNTNIIYCNDKFQRLIKEDPRDNKLISYIDENSIQPIKDFLKNEDKSIELMLKKIDGDKIFVKLEKTDISNIKPSCMLLKIEDISDLIKENNIDLEGQEKFFAFANLSPDAIMLANMFGYVTYINPAYTRLTGYTSEEIIGKHALQLQVLQGRDLQSIWDVLKQIISGKSDHITTEFGYSKKDGTPGVADGFLSHYKAGRKREIIAIIRDITEIKKREKELQNIINSSPVGIIHTDLKGNIKNLNYSAMNILEVNEVDLIGKNILDSKELEFTTDQDLDVLYDNLHSELKINSFEIKVKNSKHIEVNIGLIMAVDEKLGIQISLRDVTEQKKYTTNLEEIVQERTNQIVNNEKMIALANYSSMIAHDLKGPLQVISNSLFLLKVKPDDAQKYVTYIENAVNQANALLMDINEHSKAGKYQFEIASLKGLIDESLLIVKVTENIELETDVPSNLVLKLDKPKFGRVITNLVKNSMEAMSHGGKLVITAEIKKNVVSISICDTGVGMSKPQLNNLFEPFQSSKLKGTGIGLIFCKQTVEAHGGDLLVNSTLGKGTTFTINMPLD